MSRRFFDGAHVALVQTNGNVRSLTDGFESACDPDVSFDGKSILFSGRKTKGGPWRIWEIKLEDGSVRAVSPEGMNARSPIYVSTLFTLDSPEPWYTLVFVSGGDASRDDASVESSLYNLKLDGTELRKLTFAPGNVHDPVQMWDGRIIYAADYSALEPAVRSKSGVRIHAIHIEGADMELYGGELGPARQWMPCPTEAGLTVFIEPHERAADGAGTLAAVEHRRPHVTLKSFGQGELGRYAWSYPSPVRGGKILVSRRAAAGGNTGVYTLDLSSGLAKSVVDDPAYDEIQAKLLRPRGRPDGHSTVVNERAETGVFYGLNCYDAAPRLPMPEGQVHRVRFVEGVPLTGATNRSLGEWGRRLVGEAPVEKDGSFNVEVPANTPLLLQTLDERGMALANCGWIWVKPKESRGCIGCHEDPERIPENNYVLALRRGSTKLAVPVERRKSIGFVEHVVPILEKNCATADCHGGIETPLRLNVPNEGGDAALKAVYDLLMQAESGASTVRGKYINAGRARTSWLAWQIAGTNTARAWDGAMPERKVRLMPPADHGKPLNVDDFATLIQWMDLGAPYNALSVKAQP